MRNSSIGSFALTSFVIAALLLGLAGSMRAETSTNLVTQPLSLADCIDLALKQNSTILKGKNDLEANYGVIVQTRSVVRPKVRASGNFTANDPRTIETFPSPFPISQPDQNWTARIQITQSIYEGGRMNSALRSAKLTRAQALANYQVVVADTLLSVRIAYDDALLAAQQIVVQEASVKLLQQELEDTQRRFDAGTVPQFNVLRAEVEQANARPKLIRARNAHRNAKNNLSNLLGFNLPREVMEEIPLQLSGTLSAEPYNIELPVAILQALQQRPELAVLRQSEKLRAEAITNARSGYKPGVQLFAGYGSRNSSFTDNLSRDLSGWFTGAQLSWDIFDGGLTRGRLIEANALHEKSRVEIDESQRRIELEVRTAYSDFVEAKELLESQKKVREQAEESLRLATARAEAGTATQLDVLSAQTALTEARTTQIQALRDYSVARARMERATGAGSVPTTSK